MSAGYPLFNGWLIDESLTNHSTGSQKLSAPLPAPVCSVLYTNSIGNVNMKEYYKVDIPEGYRVYERDFEVAGIQYRKANFVKVMKKGALVTFSLRPESENPKDENAIQVRGARKSFLGTIDKHIGYIPAPIASHISDSNTLDHVKIRPKKLYVNENGFVEFVVDLIGPKERYEQYKSV